MHPAAQDLPKYGHLFGLFTGAYDRGSKAFGMIEERLGEAAFLDFTANARGEVRLADAAGGGLPRELEAYTGRDWGEFFDHWIYGKGLTDWKIEKVTVDGRSGPRTSRELPLFSHGPRSRQKRRIHGTRPRSRSPSAECGQSPRSRRICPSRSTCPSSGPLLVPLGDGTWRVTCV